MLNGQLTSDQKTLIARARTFARDVVAPCVAEMDETNAYPWPIVEVLARERFLGMTIPADYGGQGRSLTDALLVVEELAKICGTVARIVVDANTAVPKAII